MTDLTFEEYTDLKLKSCPSSFKWSLAIQLFQLKDIYKDKIMDYDAWDKCFSEWREYHV